MPFPNEPLDPVNSAVDRVRLTVGDFEPLEVELDYELYNYFLLTSADDENKASIMAINALIAKYSRAMEESTNETSVKLRERLLGYRELKDSIVKASASFEIYASGLSRKERVQDRRNNDLRDNQLAVGQANGNFSSIHKNQLLDFDAYY